MYLMGNCHIFPGRTRWYPNVHVQFCVSLNEIVESPLRRSILDGRISCRERTATSRPYGGIRRGYEQWIKIQCPFAM